MGTIHFLFKWLYHLHEISFKVTVSLCRFVRMSRASCTGSIQLQWCHIVLTSINCVLELAFCHLSLVLACLSVLPCRKPPETQVELCVLGLNRFPVCVGFDLASWDAGRAVGLGAVCAALHPMLVEVGTGTKMKLWPSGAESKVARLAVPPQPQALLEWGWAGESGVWMSGWVGSTSILWHAMNSLGTCFREIVFIVLCSLTLLCSDNLLHELFSLLLVYGSR